jgi:hypothetical protein
MAGKFSLKKLQPGNILAGLVSTFVPGGSAAVSIVQRSISSVKQTVNRGAQQALQQVQAARAAGVPAVYQTPPAPVIQNAAAGQTPIAGVTATAMPWVIGGAVLLAAVFLFRRR